MKVKELIDKLKKTDMNADVYISINDSEDEYRNAKVFHDTDQDYNINDVFITGYDRV